jgi:hypothetical protein
MKAISVACALVLVLAATVTADPVLPDYTFKLVEGKPGVIPGTTNRANYSTLAITSPNPIDTGQGAGHQYLVTSGNTTGGSKYHQLQFYHRNAVVAYDDVNSSDSLVTALNHGDHYYESSSRPPGEFVQASVVGPGQTSKAWRVTSVFGRMTEDDYWLVPTGSSDGPLREWQPRDTRDGATYNSYLVYPEANPATTSLDNYDPTGALGVHHTTTSNGYWGTSGYNKRGGLYAETLSHGTANEIVRGLSYGTHWSSGAIGFGLFEVGAWVAPADPMQELGTRPKVSESFLMDATAYHTLVPNVADSFAGWYHDGSYLYFLSTDGTNVYLSGIEITDWATAAWTQVDLSSTDDMYQTFTFDSGDPNSSLMSASGAVFGPDPDNPEGPPLLYINNGKQRIFVLEAAADTVIPEPGAAAGLLLGLGFIVRRRRR